MLGIVRAGEVREGRLTAAQQKSPQQISPATQKVSAQQVEFLDMQKGARSVDFGMQHESVVEENQ